ncbi:MAG TPA: hypothetical protein DDW20_04270 [Firmicutes bacterium]|nr:hypothetical protein [Bacillota bacterium]
MSKFCFANYIKIIKNHGRNKKIANEKIIGDLMTDVCYACKTVNKSGDEYYNSKELASKLINRKEDLPKAFKETLLNNSLKTINNGLIEYNFYKQYINPNEISHLVTSLKDLYVNDSEIANDAKDRLCNLKCTSFEMISYLLMECGKINNKLMSEKNTIFAFGHNKVNYVYDDIINLSFAVKRNIKEKIVVIPVDADFNMRVSNFGDDKFFVTENSIHGKWLQALHEKGITESEIVNRIKYKNRQNNIGSIGEFKYSKTLFYLLACSKFDENNVAHSSKIKIKEAIIALLNYYNSFGQRYELYIPLLGTKSSRAKLSNAASFDLILSTIKENEILLNGTINIVIYIKDKEEMENFLNAL